MSRSPVVKPVLCPYCRRPFPSEGAVDTHIKALHRKLEARRIAAAAVAGKNS